MELLLTILPALILSPSVAFVVTKWVNRSGIEPLLLVQKSATLAIRSLDMDEDFQWDEDGLGTFTNICYEVMHNKSDDMKTKEFVQSLQTLNAAFKYLKLTSRHNIVDHKVKPMFDRANNITLSDHYSITISALLSTCFGIIAYLNCLSRSGKEV